MAHSRDLGTVRSGPVSPGELLPYLTEHRYFGASPQIAARREKKDALLCLTLSGGRGDARLLKNPSLLSCPSLRFVIGLAKSGHLHQTNTASVGRLIDRAVSYAIENSEPAGIDAHLVGREAGAAMSGVVDLLEVVMSRRSCDVLDQARAALVRDVGTAIVRQADRDLCDAVPELWPTTLAHVSFVTIVDFLRCDSDGPAPIQGFSDPVLPGVVMLSRRILARADLVAQCLLHEALHQKLFDIDERHPLTQDDVTVGPVARIPWRSANNQPDWNVPRVLGAFHVYVHLAILAARQKRIGPETEKTRITAAERAKFLGDWLLQGGRVGLTGTGLDFVDWLMVPTRQMA